MRNVNPVSAIVLRSTPVQLLPPSPLSCVHQSRFATNFSIFILHPCLTKSGTRLNRAGNAEFLPLPLTWTRGWVEVSCKVVRTLGVIVTVPTCCDLVSGGGIGAELPLFSEMKTLIA